MMEYLWCNEDKILSELDASLRFRSIQEQWEALDVREHDEVLLDEQAARFHEWVDASFGDEDAEDDEVILSKGHAFVDNEHCLLILTNERWLTFPFVPRKTSRFRAVMLGIIRRIPIVGELLSLYSMMATNVRFWWQRRSGAFARKMEELMAKSDDFWLEHDEVHPPIVDMAYEHFFHDIWQIEVKTRRFGKGWVIDLLPRRFREVFRMLEDPYIYFSEHKPIYKRVFATLCGYYLARGILVRVKETKRGFELDCVDDPLE